MESSLRDGHDNEVSATWGDKSVSIVGLHSFVVFMLTLALIGLGLLLREAVRNSNDAIQGVYAAIDKQTKDQTVEHVAVQKEMREHMTAMHDSHARIIESIDIQNYLMTKNEAERRLFKMDMPPALRSRIR